MECYATFKSLKCLFAAKPILKHLDPSAPFVIQAHFSDVAVGAVLLQKNDQGVLQPYAYSSKRLSDAVRSWAVWVKESYAMQWVLLM